MVLHLRTMLAVVLAATTLAGCNLDTMLANFPRNVPLHFVWSIQAHKGSRTARSIEKHRLIFNRL